MAVRIQQQRTKGWKKPPNAISVTRSGAYGNPFVAVPPEKGYRPGWSVMPSDGRFHSIGYRRVERAYELIPCESERHAHELAVHLFRKWITDPRQHDVLDRVRRELVGHDLMCFCPPDLPCHADVLLELTNVSP